MLNWIHIASTWKEWADDQALPAQRIVSGVYVLLDLAGGVQYIGQSSDIARRLEEHRNGTDAISGNYHTAPKDFHRALFLPVAANSDRLRLEGMLILALAPRLNRALFLRLSRSEETGEPLVSQFDPRSAKRGKAAPRKVARRRVEPRHGGRRP